MWHKRLLLYPSARDLTYWVCATPDGDVYEEGLIEADPENWAIRSYGLAGFSDRPQDQHHEVYDFEPPFLLDDIRKWMDTAKAESKRLLREKGEELVSSFNRFLLAGKWLDMDNGFKDADDVPFRRLPGKTPSSSGPKPGGSAPADGLDVKVWVSLEKTDHCNPGDVIADADVKSAVGDRGVAMISSSQFFVVQVDDAGHQKFFKEVAVRMIGDWRDSELVDTEVDARVLPINNQTGRVEKRHRRWRLVADAVTEESFDDWPLEDTIRTADWLVQTIARSDRGPIDHVEFYLSKNPYQPSDRSQFELRCLAEILEVASTYDQLSLASLACFETLARRWQMILDAHARNPLAPNYEASEYYSGSRRGRHGIAPSLSAHVARVMKDESEIEKQRSKAREPGDGKGGNRKEHK